MRCIDLLVLILFCIPAFGQDMAKSDTKPKTAAPTTEAALTTEEVREGQSWLKQINEAQRLKVLAQKVLETADGDAKLLAYEVREQQIAIAAKLQEGSAAWVLKVQKRTGCFDCNYLDFDKGVIAKEVAKK